MPDKKKRNETWRDKASTEKQIMNERQARSFLSLPLRQRLARDMNESASHVYNESLLSFSLSSLDGRDIMSVRKLPAHEKSSKEKAGNILLSKTFPFIGQPIALPGVDLWIISSLPRNFYRSDMLCVWGHFHRWHAWTQRKVQDSRMDRQAVGSWFMSISVCVLKVFSFARPLCFFESMVEPYRSMSHESVVNRQSTRRKIGMTTMDSQLFSSLAAAQRKSS